MELDDRGMDTTIFFIGKDQKLLAQKIEIDDKVNLHHKGELVEAVIKSMEGNHFVGSIKNAGNPDLIGSEIKFSEKNIFGVEKY